MDGLRFIRTVSGNAHYWSVFCTIPTGENLYQAAMKRLYEDAKPQVNQAVINLREDYKALSYVGIVCKHAITISGDLVQFFPSGPGRPHRAPVRGTRQERRSRRGTSTGAEHDTLDTAGHSRPATRRTAATDQGLQPAIHDLSPTEGAPGTRITIVGEHLDHAKAIWLGTKASGWKKLALERKSSRRVYGTVPESARSGVLVLHTPKQYITTRHRFVVQAREIESSPPELDRPKTLSANRIKKIMLGLIPRLRDCFRKHGARGIIKLKISIKGATGVAENVRAVGRYRRSRTAQCAVQVVSGTFFGKFRDDDKSFTYPVKY